MTCSLLSFVCGLGVLCGMWQLVIGGTYARVRSLNIVQVTGVYSLAYFRRHTLTHTLRSRSESESSQFRPARMVRIYAATATVSQRNV